MDMIYINDKEYIFKKAQSLTDLFQAVQMNVTNGIAVAVNNKVIPKTDWNVYLVNQNDKIILIKATQGG